MMRTRIALISLGLAWALLGGAPAAAEDSKLKEATREVESGAKKLGQGIEDTAKGIGKTVVEGAKTAGEKLGEAGRAAEPEARTAWSRFKDGASSVGQSVKSFFSRLFGG